MARPCSWCVSPYADAALAALGAGEPRVAVCRRYGLSRRQLLRHEQHSDDPYETEPYRAVRAEIVEADGGPFTIIPRLEELLLHVREARSQWASRYQAQAAFLRLERDLLNDIAKYRGELPQRATINIGDVPEWRLVLNALTSHPRALHAVSVALKDGDGG